MNKVDILNKYQFYNNANNSIKKEFEQSSKIVHLPVGTYYYHEDDPCESFAFLGKGNIRVFKTGESGREITLYHVKPRETCILTSLGIVSNKNYPASAVVESDVQALIFPAATFRKWVDLYPDVRKLIFDAMAKRISNMMMLIEEITFRKVDERLAKFLIQHFNNHKSPLIEIQLTHEQIATELGSVREVVSRLLKAFECQGAITLSRGRIRLKDEELLRSQFNIKSHFV